MPAAARVLTGPAEMALTRMLVRAEVGREIAHAGLERGLGHAHHIVMRHDPLGAVIGEGEQAAAFHQRSARWHGGEGVAAQIMVTGNSPACVSR